MSRDLHLSRTLHPRHSQLPGTVKTLGDAIAMVEDLPPIAGDEIRWEQVRDLLHAACELESPDLVEEATAQLESALKREGWMH
jgi:hypothetical protein